MCMQAKVQLGSFFTNRQVNLSGEGSIKSPTATSPDKLCTKRRTFLVAPGLRLPGQSSQRVAQPSQGQGLSHSRESGALGWYSLRKRGAPPTVTGFHACPSAHGLTIFHS